MAVATLKSLHAYLKLLENAAELKRRLPTSSNPRTMKEGLSEMSRLIGVQEEVFKETETIAALMGAPRFVMIWGEPSASEHVVRIFDISRVLLSVLIDSAHFGNAASGQRSPMSDTAQPQNPAAAALPPGWAQAKGEPLVAHTPLNRAPETPLEDLKPLLSSNAPLTCRLFRALFEHMLGFTLPSSSQQANVSFINELTGSKEHGRSFLSTALFILGAEIDRDNLMSFMMQQSLFGMPTFEHMLRNRDYCEAFYSFRRLERAFMESPTTEEANLRKRLDSCNAQFGGKPYASKIFEADERDKAKIDAYLAATDLLEAMALTPWCISLNKAVSVGSANSIRSVSIIAGHFERLGRGELTKERANQEIADHLLAFARQFSADTKPAQQLD